jgi:hypothetical protein
MVDLLYKKEQATTAQQRIKVIEAVRNLVDKVSVTHDRKYALGR